MGIIDHALPRPPVPVLLEKAVDTEKMLIAFVREGLYRLFNKKEVDVNRNYRREHELGHALLNYFTRDLHKQDSQTIRVHKLRGATASDISKVVGDKIRIFGKEIDLSPGEATIGEKEEEMFIASHPKESSIMLLAGIANTINKDNYHKYFMNIIQKSFKDPDSVSWTDFSEPYKYLQSRFKLLSGRNPTKEEMKTVFLETLSKLADLLGREDLRLCIRIIDQNLQNTPNGQLSNKSITDALRENGVDESAEEQLKNSILRLDIDAVITGFVSPETKAA